VITTRRTMGPIVDFPYGEHALRSTRGDEEVGVFRLRLSEAAGERADVLPYASTLAADREGFSRKTPLLLRMMRFATQLRCCSETLTFGYNPKL